VLIAEDEPSVREAARRLLERAGVRVLTAGNGREALSILQGEQRIDVLMTDMTMPLMSGAELIERVSLLERDLRVIVMSGHSDVGTYDSRLLCDLVLEKPFSADSLINAVRTVKATGGGFAATSLA
jgi:DNA-binding NtrC family response regulator